MQAILQHRYFTPIALLIIVLLAILHLALLPITPPGFFLDEAATGAHVVAMIHHGTNAHGEAWPLFSESLGGGYTTPIYLYPLVAWSFLFGASELSLRAFSQISTLIAVGLVAWALRYWLDKKAALIAAIVGLALPWGWLQGSLAWDPALVPLFIAISFFCFTLLLFSEKKIARITGMVILPVSLIALAYLYPPCRITAPLLYLLFYGALLYKKAISWRIVALSCVGAAIIAIPLALFMIEPSSLERSQSLSVFAHVPFVTGIALGLSNIWQLISPVFLFLAGDPNLRHSTIIQGMLGFGAIIPFFVTIFFGTKQWIGQKPFSNLSLLAVTAGIGILASLLGSALTNEGQPHSLRATAAWPFFVIIITIGWLALARYASRRLVMAATALFTVGTIAYIIDLATFYPDRAASSFDVQARDQIKHGETPSYPDLSLEYYKSR
ncbi:MAG TPA: hypothetical protein VFT59_04815 [Candidatus Saccharimonadales bacterium]|nr:hypothetical protein [Candidatus Saccharimonadales bacterium]